MSLSNPGSVSGALNFATLANPARAFYGGGGSSGGVSSLNTLSGAVVLTSTGGSVLISTVGQNINLEAPGGASVVAGSGQNIVGTPTATFWEIGDFLFCSVLISTNTLTPGLGSFTLPSGYAWTTNSQASWPQIICSGLSGTTGGVGGALIANAQSNQPGSGVNNVLTVQCTNAAGVGTPANVNVLAFGPKAPAP